MGGLYGMDNTNSNTQVYWDTTMTRVDEAAGNESSDPGTTGLSNKKLAAKLPKGFSKKIGPGMPRLITGFPT